MSPLAVKLAVTPDTRTLVVGPAPQSVVDHLFSPHRRPTIAPYDVVVAFCPNRRALDRYAASLPRRLTSAGALWLAWPKRASGLATDIGESDVRHTGLDTGLVDNKIAAIDDTWSGLRFIRRLADR